jgi:hypothetical protein
MPLRKRKEIQKVPRSCSLVLIILATAWASLAQNVIAQSDALWHEFGLAQQTNAKIGKANATLYRMNDLTDAIAAWEWQRGPAFHPCTLESFCSTDGKHTVLTSANYFIAIDGPVTKTDLVPFLAALPNKHKTALPPILDYLPRKNLVPNSARYLLGPESLKTFAPQLTSLKPDFEQGAEAQVADYKTDNGSNLKLAVFYYPSPEMARLHTAAFRQIQGFQVKQSSVLVALVFGGATDQQANDLLNQIQYEAKITWNDIPPPSPIKPLYQLLRDIIFFSGVLVALCSVAGLIYAGIRLYRRRFGTLEEDEAMTTLNLSGD